MSQKNRSEKCFEEREVMKKALISPEIEAYENTNIFSHNLEKQEVSSVKNSNLNIISENLKQYEVYPVIKKLDSSTLQIVPETGNLTKNEYPVITKFCRQDTSLSILSSEVNLVKFIKNLYYVQCEVDPVGILNIIPILESAKNNQLYNKNLVDFHVKVRTTNCSYAYH